MSKYLEDPKKMKKKELIRHVESLEGFIETLNSIIRGQHETIIIQRKLIKIREDKDVKGGT